MIYNGKNLRDFHVDYMDESAFLVVPKPSFTTTSVVGRNGDLRYFNNRYENISVNCKSIIFGDFRRYYGGLAAFLTQDQRYHKLEGFRELDTYRMAAVESIGEPTLGNFARRGLFTITFDCKPFRYLRTGDDVIEYTQSGSIYSEYIIPAKPLLRVYGYGTITIGTGTLEIASGAGTYTDIDCDRKDAYRGTDNLNKYLIVTKWPELVCGDNAITIPSTVTKIELTPRWVML